jgi:hypothetical protein
VQIKYCLSTNLPFVLLSLLVVLFLFSFRNGKAHLLAIPTLAAPTLAIVVNDASARAATAWIVHITWASSMR